MLFHSWIARLFGDARRSGGKQKKKTRTPRQSFAPSLGVTRLEPRRVLNAAPIPLDPAMLANPDSGPPSNPNQAVTITIDAGHTDTGAQAGGPQDRGLSRRICAGQRSSSAPNARIFSIVADFAFPCPAPAPAPPEYLQGQRCYAGSWCGAGCQAGARPTMGL